LQQVGIYLFNLLGKYVGSKVVASLALGTIGPNIMNGLIGKFAPSYVKEVLPQNVLDMIVSSSFNNVVMMLVPSPSTMFMMTKLAFKSIYLVFKGAKYVVVKVKDSELIEGIIDFMLHRKTEEPILNLIGNQPLTNFVVDEDYNGSNRKDYGGNNKEFVQKFTHPKARKLNPSFYDNEFKVVNQSKGENNNDKENQNYEYLSSVFRTRNETDVKGPQVFEVSEQTVKKLLNTMDHEKINLKEGKGVELNISGDEQYPELLDLLSESITASWIEVPFNEKSIHINDVPKYPISIEDSWVTLNPTAPPIFDQ